MTATRNDTATFLEQASLGVEGMLGLPLALYFETAAIIVALILLGRWLEARAKKQTSAAIRALMGLQARTPV